MYIYIFIYIYISKRNADLSFKRLSADIQLIQSDIRTVVYPGILFGRSTKSVED